MLLLALHLPYLHDASCFPFSCDQTAFVIAFSKMEGHLLWDPLEISSENYFFPLCAGSLVVFIFSIHSIS